MVLIKIMLSADLQLRFQCLRIADKKWHDELPFGHLLLTDGLQKMDSELFALGEQVGFDELAENTEFVGDQQIAAVE